MNPEGPGDDAVAELDLQTRERRAAALAQLRTFGDPVLKSPAAELARFGPELQREAAHMVSIMRDALGVGLAATDSGSCTGCSSCRRASTPPRRRSSTRSWNGSRTSSRSPRRVVSACRASGRRRAAAVCARARPDVHGESLLVEASGLEARVLQHEIDHLDGVLILDRTEREQRKGALRALREGTTYSPPSRRRRVRTVYLGTSEFAVAVLRRLATRPTDRCSSPLPRTSSRAWTQARSPARRRCRRRAGHRALSDVPGQRPGSVERIRASEARGWGRVRVWTADPRAAADPSWRC